MAPDRLGLTSTYLRLYTRHATQLTSRRYFTVNGFCLSMKFVSTVKNTARFTTVSGNARTVAFGVICNVIIACYHALRQVSSPSQVLLCHC